MRTLIFFEILKYSIGSVFWGILFTVIGVGLLFFLVKGFYPKSTFTPLSFVVGAILFVLLCFQAILLCGAISIKGMSDDVLVYIHQCLPSYWEGRAVELTPGQCQELLDKTIEEYPLVGYYVGVADFKGFNSQNIAEAMVDELNSFLNKFIWKRVGWSCLFVLTGAFIVIKTLEVYRGIKKGGKRRAAAAAQRRDNF